MNVSFSRYDKRQIKTLVQDTQPLFSKIAYNNLGKNPAVVGRLQSELAQATMLGESQAKIMKRILSVVGNAHYNARRTAQTERTRLQSQARSDTLHEAAQMGIRVTKQWSARMVNTRDTHAALNGTIVGEDEKFVTIDGNELSYPGDPSAPAREVINCRCVLVPDVVTGEGSGKKPGAEFLPGTKDYDLLSQSMGKSDYKELKDHAVPDPYESSFNILKSLGAMATNYDIIDKSTGLCYHFFEGTKIESAKTFAGYGGVKPLREEVLDGLCEEYPYSERMKWAHRKGIGYIDVDGEPIMAEVHWFQEEHVGKHKFVIKEWLE